MGDSFRLVQSGDLLCDHQYHLGAEEFPILMMYNDYDSTAAKADGRFKNLHSPESLLDTVQVLIAKPNAPSVV